MVIPKKERKKKRTFKWYEYERTANPLKKGNHYSDQYFNLLSTKMIPPSILTGVIFRRSDRPFFPGVDTLKRQKYQRFFYAILIERASELR